MRKLNFFILLFWPVLLVSQAQLTVDRTKMLIGDQISLSLTFDIPSDGNWINREVTLPDTLNSIQTISSSEPSMNVVNGLTRIEKQWVIAPFDTGYIYIPGLPIVVSQGGSTDTFITNNIPIFVEGVVIDSTGLAPIKDIIKEAKSWVDYIWLFGLIGVIGVVFLFYYLMKTRKAPVEELPEIIRPPDEIALAELDLLEAKKLWQKGEIKSYHVELTHIFRAYLEGRFNIKALESTTEEIQMQLKKTGIHPDEIKKTIDLLMLSDMVKFAKAQPRVEVHAELMAYTRDFIIRTKRFIQHQEEE